jgi:hypothetical protein
MPDLQAFEVDLLTLVVGILELVLPFDVVCYLLVLVVALKYLQYLQNKQQKSLKSL